MAKRRRTTTRTHTTQDSYRPGFSRGHGGPRMRPPSSRGVGGVWLILGTIAAIGILAVVGYAYFLAPGAGPVPTGTGAPATASPGTGPSGSPTVPATPGRTQGALQPPDATPLANPPEEPQGDGTTATIETELGTIVMEIYTDSAPVAAQNFINLAEAGYYNGIGFHRIAPGFVIQGGDPAGDGTGGPGYTIEDEAVIGDYVRGTVAMARTPQPDSQGSQFFVVLADSVAERLQKSGGYVIFGNVIEGMEVVDAIAAGERSRETALDPVIMESVTIERPE